MRESLHILIVWSKCAQARKNSHENGLFLNCHTFTKAGNENLIEISLAEQKKKTKSVSVKFTVRCEKSTKKRSFTFSQPPIEQSMKTKKGISEVKKTKSERSVSDTNRSLPLGLQSASPEIALLIIEIFSSRKRPINWDSKTVLLWWR